MSLPDIDRSTLNFILFEAPRFGAKVRDIGTSKYKNRFDIELVWTDGNGREHQFVTSQFERYRTWWFSEVVMKNFEEREAFWKAMERKRPTDHSE